VGQLTGNRAGVCPASRAPVALARLADDPPHGVIPPTPPGPEGSKGTRALTGVRGVLPLRRWVAGGPGPPRRQ